MKLGAVHCKGCGIRGPVATEDYQPSDLCPNCAARGDCKHLDAYRIGEIGGRFADEWCRDCGAMRSWDSYGLPRDMAPWIVPRNYRRTGGT